MPISQYEAIVLLIVWGIFFGLAFRSWSIGHARSWSTLSGWVQIALCLLVFSIRGAEMEQWIDDQIGLTVALMLKNIIFVIWFLLFLNFLQSVGFQSRWYGFSRRWLVGLVTALTVMAILFYIPASSEQRLIRRDVLIAMRDMLALLPAMLVFLQGSWFLLRREKMLVMQMRLFVLLLGYGILFPILAASNMLVAIDVFVDIAMLDTVRQVLNVLLYFGLLIVVMLLIPYRQMYYVAFVFPRQHWTAYHLRMLENQLGEQVENQLNVPTPRLSRLDTLLHPDRVIYQAVIKIMDHALMLKNDLRPEVLQLELIELIESDITYSKLVKGLRQIRL